MDYMVPPIKQCENKHSTCSPCRAQLPTCPLCRGKLTEKRNIDLEKKAILVQFPCKFNMNGCDKMLRHDEKIKHEKNCPKMPVYSCATANCNWNGPMGRLAEHMKEKHAVMHSNQCEGDIYFRVSGILNLTGSDQWLMTATRHGRDFLILMSQMPPDKIIAFVLLIGSPSDAKHFRCRIALCNSNKRGIKNAKLSSILDIQKVRLDKNMLIFSKTDAQSIANDGAIQLQVSITKN
ncbi:Hypothetical predicted protein [Cloeon dipterum]|uniref:E3 ubiquitin-protein ligase n=1 Tax=Cloeon dipterum TaxID=197152 RepID=A0A8S1CGD7_9INSE|nr:Hypothetical predicted protein [Cloeon dipterum]